MLKVRNLRTCLFYLLQFFIREFRRIMDSPQSSSKEISLAIKGYGFFAAVSVAGILLFIDV